MNKKLKAGLVMGLAAAAAVMAVLAVSSVAAPEDEIPDYYIEGTVSPQQAEYVLKDCDGYIGVYASAQAPAPRAGGDRTASRGDHRRVPLARRLGRHGRRDDAAARPPAAARRAAPGPSPRPARAKRCRRDPAGSCRGHDRWRRSTTSPDANSASRSSGPGRSRVRHRPSRASSRRLGRGADGSAVVRHHRRSGRGDGACP